MNIKRSIYYGLMLALVGANPVVFADLVDNSANSVTAWHAEGNVRCSDYFSNSAVQEISTSNVLTAGAILSGSDNPLDDNTASETVTYSVPITDATGKPLELSFSSSTKINAVIVKHSREVNFYAMPTGGTDNDSKLDLETGVAGDGIDGLDISAVSFCYGVSYGDAAVVADTMPACPLSCAGDEAFECNVINGKLECCSCGSAPVPGCLIGETPENGGCDGGINFTTLQPAFTGTGSSIVCYPTKKGLTCWEY